MPRPRIEMFETEDWILRIQGWARDGLTEEQIAQNMGISYRSLCRWKLQSDKIGQALKESKEVADRVVENALYKRACGYKYDEVTYERKFNADTETVEMVETKRVTKEVLPDTTAQIFWLKNRKPDEWRDKRVVEDRVSFEDDGFIEALKGQAADVFKDAESIVEE